MVTHGGIVEKFAGDAVMAAFGVPQAHEDDAERAIRAALAILDGVDELELEARIGIEAGEVVADDGDSTFATGEAVNLAARLQQAADPGEILIGPGARTASRSAGSRSRTSARSTLQGPRRADLAPGAPPVDARAARGARRASRRSSAATPSSSCSRTRSTAPSATAAPTSSRSTASRASARAASRASSSAALEGATVLAGRCLPYGEGITYWPLAEMVKCAAGIADDDPLDEAIEKLRDCCEDEAVADLLGLASGVLEAVEAERSQQEIAWAAREWAEQLAQDAAARPRLRGHPLGRGAAPRADRAPRRRGCARRRC